MKRRKGFYSISVVAKMFSVHQQTIRMYEKEGLICPKRSNGNTRLFSEEDVDRLEEVIYLTHKLGVNLAGVEMILKLKKKMKRMQDEMNKMFEQTQGQLDLDQKELAMSGKEQAQRLVDIKTENVKRARAGSIDIKNLLEQGQGQQLQDQEEKAVEAQTAIDDWQIDYDQD